MSIDERAREIVCSWIRGNDIGAGFKMMLKPQNCQRLIGLIEQALLETRKEALEDVFRAIPKGLPLEAYENGPHSHEYLCGYDFALTDTAGAIRALITKEDEQ